MAQASRPTAETTRAQAPPHTKEEEQLEEEEEEEEGEEEGGRPRGLPLMLRRRKTRRRGWRVPAPAFSFFQNFTVIVLKEKAAARVSWKQPPIDASFKTLKDQLPIAHICKTGLHFAV